MMPAGLYRPSISAKISRIVSYNAFGRRGADWFRACLRHSAARGIQISRHLYGLALWRMISSL